MKLQAASGGTRIRSLLVLAIAQPSRDFRANRRDSLGGATGRNGRGTGRLGAIGTALTLDGYGPMGPWIVMANGVKLDDVRIICRINGVGKQNASYQQMYFKVPRIIAELSRNMTLLPGDIVSTGTPPGVGFARKPPEFLKPGDVMETEITGVGILRNAVRSEV